MSFLKVENIYKSFGKTEVLKGVSFELEGSSTLALIGKSGSGKTTMLRLIAGLELPDSGSISLSDKVLSSKSVYVKPEKRGIGYVFQNHSLFPHLNVFSNIVFGAENLSKEEKLSQANKYLEMIGLQDKLKSYPHQLSGGEKQRISIVRTLLAKPRLLLLDEPFSSLDKNTKEVLKADLKKLLKEEKLPTIMITHDADDSFDLADNVILLNSGTIVSQGNPEALYKNPPNVHSAQYFSDTEIIEKSTLNLEFFTHFSISSPAVHISPHSVKICSEGLSATVIDQRFIGTGYMLSLLCKGATIRIFSSERLANTNVQISLSKDNIRELF
jgi:iron(III) transport system ATP-binding protein